jgi:hypothetical protein
MGPEIEENKEIVWFLFPFFVGGFPGRQKKIRHPGGVAAPTRFLLACLYSYHPAFFFPFLKMAISSNCLQSSESCFYRNFAICTEIAAPTGWRVGRITVIREIESTRITKKSNRQKCR